MCLSKCLVSKKGPLGAIWVAAYFFKNLKTAQIFETNISSSVDNILQDQLEIFSYRVLAYLLLGVVRIYSKKVDYLFDDCQEVLIKIKEFVVGEKNRAKKEALRATCFSITRPVNFDLDAFDLEILEDTSGGNVVPREEITLKDVNWKNVGIRQSSLDRFAALDDDFLMDYTSTEEYAHKSQFLSCHPTDFETEARTSHDICDWIASMEKLQYDKSLHEEDSHLKLVSGVEEEPPNLVKIFYKNDREHVEVPDMAGLENHMDREANREKYNNRFPSEECVNLRSEAKEDPLGSPKPLAEDQSIKEKTKGPDLSESDKEMNQATEEDHLSILEASAKVPDIAGSIKHTEREAGREKWNGRFFSKEGVNLHSEAEEEPLSSVKSLGEDRANREKMKGPDLLQSENEVHQVMEEDHVSTLKTNVEVPDIAGSENHIGTEASRENYNDKFSQEKYLNHIAEIEEKSASLIKSFGEEQTNREMMNGLDRLQIENEVHHVMEEDSNLGASMEKLLGQGFSPMNVEEPSPLVKPLGEEIQTGAEQLHFPAMTTSKDGKCQVAAKDHTLSVTLDATPRSMLQDASGPTTPHFMLIPTPATKEHARFTRKRKCFFDDVIVFPNSIMRQWIKDSSDLVSKQRKGDRTALAGRKTCWISNLPQSFSEPSVPCTSELKSLYRGKRLRLLESIMKTSEKIDTLEPPPVVGSFVQAEIAPQTVEIRDPPDKLNLSGSPPLDASSKHAGIAPQTPTQQSPSLVVGEQVEIAPQTPVLQSKSLRPFESPEYLNCDNLDEVGSANMDPSESIQKESSLNEIVEKEPSLGKDEDFDLNPYFGQEIHSNEDDNQGQDGWSMRTRMVAKQLQKSFLDQRKRGEKEKVKLSQLLERTTKKASARLFYEILVLKTKGLVDVKQDTAFGDILVLNSFLIGTKLTELMKSKTAGGSIC
ncbi:sister chromatid cohesion 1 protein 2-like isoform X3 [Durio zibethinus]|uniref:Sister chromatid cohesion 1 protein 2-like isoform X3 n=1 Tax=Durio zibethinus TaxID=66656 RepID=A0A6P6AT26_DURZI|nr:sister chromatid cohesion 1 protein 2-like isoform X3 [Durio zibethinus]